VLIIANKEYQQGYNVAFWDGTDANGALLPTGIYFVRLRAGGFEQVQKLTLVH
jgi:flagellar hook assembly protein FlgD